MEDIPKIDSSRIFWRITEVTSSSGWSCAEHFSYNIEQKGKQLKAELHTSDFSTFCPGVKINFLALH